MSNKHQASGYISLLILILLAVLSALGMEVYLKANVENRMVRRETQSIQALYAAEGGIEWAKAHLLLNPVIRQGNLTLESGRVTIDIETSGGGYKVISEGRSGFATFKIMEIIRLVDGKWFTACYQELNS